MMNLTTARRISTLIAATAIGGGLAATAFAVSASAQPHDPAATTRATASVASACADAHGKYHGKQIAQYKIWGHDSDTGKPVALGGYLKVYHSTACKTLWVTTVKNAKYTTKNRETLASIEYTKNGHKTIVSATKSTMGSVTTRAVSLGTHAKANVDGGFAADYQYEGGGTVRY
jgi:hypothetical protein